MKVVVVGAGVMGKNHARVLSSMNKLAGIVDVDESAAKEVAKKYGVKGNKNLKEIDFDAAVVATPTIHHYKIAKMIIENGKHVLVEKPFTHSIEEGEELIDCANDMGVILEVGHIERFNPIVEFFKNINEKGKLITIGAKRVSGFPKRIRDVGVVMDLGVHDIDVLRYLVGKVESVYAKGGKIKNEKYDDHASIILNFKNGKTGYIETNWLTPKKIRKLWLTYEDRYAEGDYMGQSVEISSEQIEYEEFNTYNLQIELNVRKINLRREEPLKREISNFIETIENKSKPLVTGKDGLMAVKIAKAALKSMNEGKVIDIE